MRRPGTFPDPNNPLLVAARTNDGEIDSGGDLEGVARELGLDMPALMHVAEQRALRLVLIRSGRAAEIQKATSANSAVPIDLNEGEKRMIQFLSAAYVDGIALGWLANRLADDNARDEETA